MPLRPTSSTHVGGYRFLQRRARLAATVGDVRMVHDPVRRHAMALTVGGALGAVAVAGCVVVSLLAPAPDLDHAGIVVSRESGAMFVRVGDRLRPVTGLASARLVLGEAAAPVLAKDAQLARVPKGPPVGIVGDPGTLPPARPAGEAESLRWFACDQVDPGGGPATQTAVLARREPGGELRETRADEAVVATHDGRSWVLRAGTRTEFDPSDVRLTEIFGLTGADAVPVSAAVLDTLSEVPPLARPVLPHLGEPPQFGSRDLRIGQVVAVDNAGGRTLYVVLGDGLQEVGPAVADLVRSTATVGEVVRLAPDELDVPRSTALDVSPYPPRRVTPTRGGQVCGSWGLDEARTGARTQVLVGDRLPGSPPGVQVAGADGDGPAVDLVSVPGGGVTVAPVGAGGASWPRVAARGVVSESGARFDVPDLDTAGDLGLDGTPVYCPAGILALLPAGPVLSRAAARVERDTAGVEPAAARVLPGGR